jgi:hypothetical protein
VYLLANLILGSWGRAFESCPRHHKIRVIARACTNRAILERLRSDHVPTVCHPPRAAWRAGENF